MSTILGIGSPLLDSTLNIDTSYLEVNNLKKGEMRLVDEKEQATLLQDVRVEELRSSAGGSVANTLAAASKLGGDAGFIGVIGDDEFGTLYEELLAEAKVTSKLIRSEIPQGKCLVFVTGDGERTFATYLGAALELTEYDIVPELFENTKILHLEGYQFDGPNNTKAVRKAIHIAKEKKIMISLDLGDIGVIERHEKLIEELLPDIDIIFANEIEAFTYAKNNDEITAVQTLGKHGAIAIMKLGKTGSLISHKNTLYKIPGYEVEMVNTNGAGDAYAGAFLQSIIEGKDLNVAGSIASYAAAQVVAQEEAMLKKDIREDLEKIL